MHTANSGSYSKPLASPVFATILARFLPGPILTVRRPLSLQLVLFLQLTQQASLSHAIGATWNMGGGYSAALSLARAERAPNQF